MRPAFVERLTVRGMAAPPRVEPVPPADVPGAPESWVGKTLLPIDDLHAGPSGVVEPARIISVGPGPMPADPTENDDDDGDRPPEVQSTKMVALRSPLHAPMTVITVESAPPPSRGPSSRPGGLHDPRLVLLLEPDSQRSASFRLLRDNVLAKSAPRVIAVSSGAHHEGKTTCAINLALALCEQPSTRVLLLEGNFFAPSLGGIFGIDASTQAAPQMGLPWLSPYRIVEVTRSFHVAAVVQAEGEPTPLFNSRWFEMALSHLLGAGYHHFVIDAASLDGSPGVTQIIGAADGTLLTVRSGGTTARSFRRAAEQIPKTRALGVVLMDGDT
jgi:Mrp family chromosome partitioning ATPase